MAGRDGIRLAQANWPASSIILSNRSFTGVLYRDKR
jgi:hypothetical protein